MNEKVRNSEDFKSIINVIGKFQKIEEKNRCLRVQFLDWLSIVLANWSRKVKELSDRIDSPCVIKIGEKK